jgi:hypothetical protein
MSADEFLVAVVVTTTEIWEKGGLQSLYNVGRVILPVSKRKMPG